MRRCLALVALIRVLHASPSLAQQVAPPILAKGEGKLEKFSPVDGETLAVSLKMRNTIDQPVTVTRAEVLLSCQGGWSNALGEMIAKDGKLFGHPPVLDAGGEYVFQFNYGFSTPVTHYLLALQLSTPNRKPHDYFLQVPFVRQGFPSPPTLKATAPVFIGLQEPIEVLELTSGEIWLPVIGQINNSSGKPLTLRRWQFSLKAPGGVGILDQDLTSGYRVEKSTETINEFLYGFLMPSQFRKGTLRISAEFDVGGERKSIVREADVERVPGYRVRPPVQGDWLWDHGPGELEFHTHYHYPEQRYAYDLGIRKDVDGKPSTSSGDPNRNESYFAWDQPIYCVEDGKVQLVVDDVPDNNGHTPNPANNPMRTACVVVEHANSRISGYFHVRQGSAKVKVGQTVKAGDILAHVGNAGSSSEPHLHFGYQIPDRTGRLRTVPVRVQGLARDGKPVEGVPKGNVVYRSGPAR